MFLTRVDVVGCVESIACDARQRKKLLVGDRVVDLKKVTKQTNTHLTNSRLTHVNWVKVSALENNESLYSLQPFYTHCECAMFFYAFVCCSFFALVEIAFVILTRFRCSWQINCLFLLFILTSNSVPFNSHTSQFFSRFSLALFLRYFYFIFCFRAFNLI